MVTIPTVNRRTAYRFNAPVSSSPMTAASCSSARADERSQVDPLPGAGDVEHESPCHGACASGVEGEGGGGRCFR